MTEQKESIGSFGLGLRNLIYKPKSWLMKWNKRFVMALTLNRIWTIAGKSPRKSKTKQPDYFVSLKIPQIF